MSGSRTAGTGGNKELQPHLEPMAVALQTVHQGGGGGGVRHIEGHDQSLAGLLQAGSPRADARKRRRDSGALEWA